ncbi:hypothetical protein Efla_002459 [Eimeria flavescens]
MGFIGSSALALGAAAAVILAVLVAFHDLAFERLRRYCTPTQEEAEWAAAYVDVADGDVDLLSYGEDQLGGAESFLEEPDGCLLTGLWDGRIVRLLSDQRFQHVATTGRHHGAACSLEKQKDESTRCSRVLGLQFASPPRKGDATSRLVVCDAWRGLLQVPVPSRQQVENGAPPAAAADTRELLLAKDSAALHIANAITEETNGRFFVTDSSLRSDAGRFGLIAFEGARFGTGRLLSVDLKADKAEVIGEKIPFANGAAVTFDKSAVLVSALTAGQIREYPLKRSDTHDFRVFASLPILPDNISRVEIKGRRLYAVVSYGAPFLPPFVASSESDGFLAQLRASVWTAFSRATRSLKPFPVFGGFLFPVLNLLPSSLFDAIVKLSARKSSRGGQVVFLDEQGKLQKWLSLPPKCKYSSEVKLHRWPGSSEPVLLVGAFRPEQPLCQVRIGKYL